MGYSIGRSSSGDSLQLRLLWEAYGKAIDEMDHKKLYGKYRDDACEDIKNEYDIRKQYDRNNSIVGSTRCLKSMKQKVVQSYAVLESKLEDSESSDIMKNIEELHLNIELEESIVAALKVEIKKIKKQSARKLSVSDKEHLTATLSMLRQDAKTFANLLLDKNKELLRLDEEISKSKEH